jgi:hypothetical protein
MIWLEKNGVLIVGQKRENKGIANCENAIQWPVVSRLIHYWIQAMKLN